jgi:benzoylformate decarboxylase
MPNGIPRIFGHPGSSEENPRCAEQPRSREFAGLRHCLALHEGAAVAIADADGRAAPAVQRDGDSRPWRRPAVVQVHSYAGLANGLGIAHTAGRGRYHGTPSYP